MNLDPSQIAAVDRACVANTIITGGAGYGKTTIIRNILNRTPGAQLLAPTGKAARRMSDLTGYPASTIHSALQWNGAQFMRSPKKPLEAPTIIIDEASMVESWLLFHLLQRTIAHIILVGDDAQLPPVGPGQPFHDLIQIRPDIVARLDKCHRAHAAIHIASAAIRAGTLPPPELRSDSEFWKIAEAGTPAHAMRTIGRWLGAGKFDPAQDVFLAPSYGADAEDVAKIHSINQMVKKYFLGDTGNDFDVNDRVMICKNFGPEDLWNGDTGQIVAINKYPEIILDRERTEVQHCPTRKLSAAQTRELTLAYCLSVHKSQGSQYRRVFFVCLPHSRYMLDRKLVYTAITRAQSACIVLGHTPTFAAAIKRVKERPTCLRELDGRFQGDLLPG